MNDRAPARRTRCVAPRRAGRLRKLEPPASQEAHYEAMLGSLDALVAAMRNPKTLR